jgi:hypothetical protein
VEVSSESNHVYVTTYKVKHYPPFGIGVKCASSPKKNERQLKVFENNFISADARVIDEMLFSMHEREENCMDLGNSSPKSEENIFLLLV